MFSLMNLLLWILAPQTENNHLDILFLDRFKFVIEKGEPFSEKKICHPAIKVIEANRGELLAEYKLINSSLEYEN